MPPALHHPRRRPSLLHRPRPASRHAPRPTLLYRSRPPPRRRSNFIICNIPSRFFFSCYKIGVICLNISWLRPRQAVRIYPGGSGAGEGKPPPVWRRVSNARKKCIFAFWGGEIWASALTVRILRFFGRVVGFRRQRCKISANARVLHGFSGRGKGLKN